MSQIKQLLEQNEWLPQQEQPFPKADAAALKRAITLSDKDWKAIACILERQYNREFDVGDDAAFQEWSAMTSFMLAELDLP
jgi:hypothetical protein